MTLNAFATAVQHACPMPSFPIASVRQARGGGDARPRDGQAAPRLRHGDDRGARVADLLVARGRTCLGLSALLRLFPIHPPTEVGPPLGARARGGLRAALPALGGLRGGGDHGGGRRAATKGELLGKGLLSYSLDQPAPTPPLRPAGCRSSTAFRPSPSRAGTTSSTASCCWTRTSPPRRCPQTAAW